MTQPSSLPDFVLIPIADIDIGARYRTDPTKDLDTLADSIDELGLLHPIVLTADHRLVAGQRRILACQKLGYDQIEAHILGDLTDADVLLGEHDENICRQPFTTGEARKLWNQRKALLAPVAEEHKQANLKQGTAKTPNRNDTGSGDTRDLAAKGTGKSGKTLENVEKIAAIAADDSLPDVVRELATDTLAAVEADEKPAAPALALVKDAVAAVNSDTQRGQKKAMKYACKALEKHADELEAAFLDAANYDSDMNPELAKDNWRIITDATRRINRVAKVKI
jgi:ParB-like chromosome segregation protein Spo0J